MKAEIISIGTELLMGETVDTNAAYLAAQLVPLGVELYWVSQVGDNQTRLVQVLKRAWRRSDLILTSGGLGPTADDLTREAIAEMLGEKPEIDPSLEQVLRGRFSRMAAEMPLSNLKQATIIPSAEPLPNAAGTAPGWWVKKDGRMLVAMPGPPRELEQMWQEQVRPRLLHASGCVILTRTFKTSGLSEGAVGERVAPLFSSLNPFLGIYAKPDGIHLRLAAKAESRERAEKMLSECEVDIRAALGDYIWGTDDDTLEMAIGRLLVERGLTLAAMEDYSGGWLTASLGDVPGSPSFFMGGIVAVSHESKIAFGVSPGALQHGAVSPEVARAMAEAARSRLKADIGISINASGEASDRPSGIAYIGIAGSGRSDTVSRASRRKQHVAASALFELRRRLLSPDQSE